MNNYINCITHASSEGNLLVGENYTALIDCGMTFCAEKTIGKVKEALKGRALDYIFFSHTHYDHIGALPFFRKEWPALQTLTTGIGAEVLLKATPRRVFRELSIRAAETYCLPVDSIYSGSNYSDDVFRGDVIVKDGDSIPLGALTVEVLETPGHTRDCLSFFIPELELLVSNETMGVLLPWGDVFPGFLSSYNETIKSMEKCRNIPHKFLSLPHRGLVSQGEMKSFFDKALAQTSACREFILGLKKKGLDENEMLDSFYKEYSSRKLLEYQPEEAFMLNARAAISCLMREEL